MKCPHCGFDNQVGLKFCGQCGASLAKICPRCSFANPGNYNFCGNCGARLPGAIFPASAEEPVPAASVGPTQQPEPARTAGVALVGERRMATVILADVRDSTGLLERIGSEPWVEIMNRVFRILEAEIYRFGGIVDQFRGDGLVAFFGSMVAHEDDPERAILASLNMQKTLAGYAAELAAKEGIDLKLRVGINTGEVIVTTVGENTQHMEDTAMGAAVAVAARMETSAEPGTILVSENTHNLVKEHFIWQSMGEIMVKGISAPIATFRPIAPQPDAGESLDLAQPETPLRMVGRAEQFDQLFGVIGSLDQDHGGIVLLTGEKGSGKTFLVNVVNQRMSQKDSQPVELGKRRKKTAQAGNEGKMPSQVISLRGSCHSYNQGWPYSVWRELIGRWLEVNPENSKEEISALLYQKVEALWNDETEQYTPFLAVLLDLTLDEKTADRISHMDAQSLKGQIYLTVYKWLEALAHQAPLILALSEMHFADTSSLDLLEYCLPLCELDAVLFLLVFAADRNSLVWQLRHRIETTYPHRLTFIDLPPLTAAESSELIDQVIGPGVLSAETRELVVQKSDGNPYFIQQLLQSLKDQGVLEQEEGDGKWRETRQVTSVDLPDGLNNLLLARIDSLPIDERRVLQMASVIGVTFWGNILKVLVEDPQHLYLSLINLQRAQLIQQQSRLPDLGIEYVFRSSLIRDVAYEGLLTAQRVASHQKVAAALEMDVSPDARQRYDGLIAYHYRQSGNRNKELFYTLQAAAQANQVYANREALEHYDRALELLDELEVGVTDLEQIYVIRTHRFEVYMGRRSILYKMGDIEAERKDEKALLALANQMNDDPAWMVDALLAQPELYSYRSRDELREGLKMAEKALDLARKMKDRRREMYSLIALGRAHSGLREPFWDEVNLALGIARELNDLVVEVNLLVGIGTAYGMENAARSREYLEDALRKSQQLDDKPIQITLLDALGQQFERVGDYYRQLTEFETRRLQVTRQTGFRLAEGQSLMFSGQITGLYLGDYAAGLDLLRQALEIWGHLPDRLFPLLRIAQIYIEKGDLDQAQATLDQAISDYIGLPMDLGRAGFDLVSAILFNAMGKEEHFRSALEHTVKVEQMVENTLVSRQYKMAADCESTLAHLGLADHAADEPEKQEHLRQALECSEAALAIYEEYGFAQVVECTSEEVYYHHSLALAANGRSDEAADALALAYHEMMRKLDFLPQNSHYRKTYLENIRLHRKIKTAFEKKK